MKTQIIVIDMGSQYTRLITRTARELGVRSLILNPAEAVSWLKSNRPRGIILSGGNFSIYQEGAPVFPRIILRENMPPILGICYGMQSLASELGGSVAPVAKSREYGRTEVSFNRADPLFRGLPRRSIAWESHSDSVEVLPPNFKSIAQSADGKTIAGMSNREKRIWAVQFHPEVSHTKNGKDILRNFLLDICSCQPDWKPQDVIAEIQREVVDATAGEKIMIGFSGGVDSTTLSAILAPVIGDNLQAVCIDTGALREGEIDEIRENAKAAGVKLKVIRASKLFQEAIGNTSDAETKRKRFRRCYARILSRAAKEFGAKTIIQASLGPDLIESGCTGKAAIIKTHHNTNCRFGCAQLHPFRNLFKYEVRKLAKEIGLPESVYRRHPFPGPGLFIRVIGKPPKPDKLAIVHWADDQVAQILRKHGQFRKPSQIVVALFCGDKTVGIKGDGRVYTGSVVVRAVTTKDFMTAEGYQFPPKVRREISSVLTTHPKIGRVLFDEMDKPPAPIEFE